MIGIVVVSHSSKVAEGICDMVQQISSRDGETMPIYPAGGNAQGGLGTDPQRVLEAIIVDAPILEGAIGAGVEAASDDASSLDLVVSTAEGARQLHKK